MGKLFRWKNCLNGKLASIEKKLIRKKLYEKLNVLKNYLH
jgi:hypothetical protein